MKKYLLILAVISLPFMAHASKIKIYKDVKVDTLRLWLNTDGIADQKLANELQDIFKKEVIDFNHSKEATFNVELDTAISNGRIIFLLGPINYVNAGRSLSTSALDLGLIAGHVLLIANYGFTIPVWPFFMPKTNSLVEIRLDTETFRPASQMEMMIGKNGYFAGIERQNKNFKKKFSNTISKQLNSINKQNIKNKQNLNIE